MKLNPPIKNVYDVPVILMKEVKGRRDKELDDQKKAIHDGASTYYNPEVDQPKYELDHDNDMMDRVFDIYKDTIKHDRKAVLHSDAKEDESVMEIINH